MTGSDHNDIRYIIERRYVVGHGLSKVKPTRHERAIMLLVEGLREYEETFAEANDGRKPNDDGYADTYYADMVRGLRGLLSCDTGRLDCGLLDRYLVQLLPEDDR